MPRVWVIRGGEKNRLVDDFVDNGVIGVGYFAVPDGSTLTPSEVYELLMAEGTSGIPVRHASMFVHFVRTMTEGDVVLMPDTPRGDVVVGEIAGPYAYHDHLPVERYRHRRPVRWLGRVGVDELPRGREVLHKQRSTLLEISFADDILALAQRVRSGALGRPPERRSRRRGAYVRPGVVGGRAERVCPGCGLLKPVSQFGDGGERCVDCD